VEIVVFPLELISVFQCSVECRGKCSMWFGGV